MCIRDRCHIVVPGSIGIESITIKLHDCIKGKHYLHISALYNPPQIDINSAFLSSLLCISEYSLVLGDLNAHHSAWQSTQTNKSGSAIYELLSSNKLINEKATYTPLARPFSTLHSARSLSVLMKKMLTIMDQTTSQSAPEI